jgi:hypothetical protein
LLGVMCSVIDIPAFPILLRLGAAFALEPGRITPLSLTRPDPSETAAAREPLESLSAWPWWRGGTRPDGRLVRDPPATWNGAGRAEAIAEPRRRLERPALTFSLTRRCPAGPPSETWA